MPPQIPPYPTSEPEDEETKDEEEGDEDNADGCELDEHSSDPDEEDLDDGLRDISGTWELKCPVMERVDK